MHRTKLLLFCILVFAILNPVHANSQEVQSEFDQFHSWMTAEPNDHRQFTWKQLKALSHKLAELPKGHRVRLDAIDLARRFADVSIGPPRSDLSPSRNVRRVNYAFAFLMDLDILRPGLDVEETVAIIGMPTQLDDGRAIWQTSFSDTKNARLTAAFGADDSAISFTSGLKYPEREVNGPFHRRKVEMRKHWESRHRTDETSDES